MKKVRADSSDGGNDNSVIKEAKGDEKGEDVQQPHENATNIEKQEDLSEQLKAEPIPVQIDAEPKEED